MLLSACIIAKDESASLLRCLAPLAGLVDEVVVYDTGSTDGTVALAEGAGARVVRGSWPGSFADARNAAIGHCLGAWVLSIDADEEAVVADPADLRAQLAAAPSEVDALQVSIDNLGAAGLGGGYAHVAERLFRRERCRWRGRLHEQLVTGDAGRLTTSRHLPVLRLRHHGYVPGLAVAQAKAERNLQLAQAEVEDPSFGDRGIALVWLGRALWAAGRAEEALPTLLNGARTTENPTARRQGLAVAARLALALGRTDVAADAVAELRTASTSPVAADVLEAGVHLAAGRYRAALELLATVTAPVRDDDGYEHSPRSTAEWRAAALLGAGSPGEAADGLLAPLRDEGVLVADLDLLVAALEQAGRPLDELATAAPGPAVVTVAAGAARLRPDRSHRVLEALWRRWGTEDVGRADSPAMAVLAGASLAGRLLPAARAATWSAHLRAAGLAELCPLVALAGDDSAPPRRRLEAAVAAAQAGDEAMAALVPALAAVLPEAALHHVELPEPVRAAADDLRAQGIPVPREAAGRGGGERGQAGAGRDRPQASLVLVASGGAERVLGCLQTLAATLPADLPFELVVVTAGADAAIRSVVGAVSGDVVVVDGPLPVGRARARNLGLAAAAAEIVCFVDPVARPEPGWLAPLVAGLRDDPALGCLGSALRTAAGDLVAGGHVRAEESSGRAAGLARRPWGASGRLGPTVDWLRVGGAGAGSPMAVEVVPGHVVAVRRRAVDEIGGFDEAYWNGGEVAELCARLTAEGWAVACDPSSAAGDDSGTDLAAVLWAERDPARVPLMVAAGPRWQWRDNRERYTQRWLAPELVP